MFGVGFQEIVIIGLLFLVVFGPNKLTGTARELGRFMREARRSVEQFKAELMSEEDPYDEHESERPEQH
jgi:sec-independent protein translocase protein TatB